MFVMINTFDTRGGHEDGDAQKGDDDPDRVAYLVCEIVEGVVTGRASLAPRGS